MDNYEQLENALNARLQGFFFECLPLPDDQAGFNSNFKPRVYVMYDNSDYTDTENLNATVQEDKIRVGFEIHARTRRGDEGIFAIQRLIYNRLLGYKMVGFDKMQLLSFSPLNGNSPNHWMYYIQMTTVGHVSESTEDVDEPLLKTVTLIPPDE